MWLLLNLFVFWDAAFRKESLKVMLKNSCLIHPRLPKTDQSYLSSFSAESFIFRLKWPFSQYMALLVFFSNFLSELSHLILPSNQDRLISRKHCSSLFVVRWFSIWQGGYYESTLKKVGAGPSSIPLFRARPPARDPDDGRVARVWPRRGRVPLHVLRRPGDLWLDFGFLWENRLKAIAENVTGVHLWFDI